MTAILFLQTVFSVTGCVAIAAFLIAGMCVVVFYSYKMAVALIKGRKRYVRKIKRALTKEIIKEPKQEIAVVGKKAASAK